MFDVGVCFSVDKRRTQYNGYLCGYEVMHTFISHFNEKKECTHHSFDLGLSVNTKNTTRKSVNTEMMLDFRDMLRDMLIQDALSGKLQYSMDAYDVTTGRRYASKGSYREKPIILDDDEDEVDNNDATVVTAKVDVVTDYKFSSESGKPLAQPAVVTTLDFEEISMPVSTSDKRETCVQALSKLGIWASPTPDIRAAYTTLKSRLTAGTLRRACRILDQKCDKRATEELKIKRVSEDDDVDTCMEILMQLAYGE